MALISPIATGLTRIWKLSSTAISSATPSDTAVGGLQVRIGTLYVITSGTVLMTITVEESPDGGSSNWCPIYQEEITGNKAYRITHPFSYLRVNVPTYTSGQIDNIELIGIIQ